jgi:hypothetical protein
MSGRAADLLGETTEVPSAGKPLKQFEAERTVSK